MISIIIFQARGFFETLAALGSPNVGSNTVVAPTIMNARDRQTIMRQLLNWFNGLSFDREMKWKNAVRYFIICFYFWEILKVNIILDYISISMHLNLILLHRIF
jgi:hypothetical protein